MHYYTLIRQVVMRLVQHMVVILELIPCGPIDGETNAVLGSSVEQAKVVKRLKDQPSKTLDNLSCARVYGNMTL